MAKTHLPPGFPVPPEPAEPGLWVTIERTLEAVRTLEARSVFEQMYEIGNRSLGFACVVLGFVGVKMLLAHTTWRIETLPALLVVATVITASIAASLLCRRRPKRGTRKLLISSRSVSTRQRQIARPSSENLDRNRLLRRYAARSATGLSKRNLRKAA